MKYRIYAGLLAIYVFWGSTYLAIRFAVETMPPFLMAATRFLVSGVILFAWRRAAGDTLPTRPQLRSAAIVGLFLLLGGNGSVVWAEQRVVSGIAALLVGSVPLWMVVLDLLRPKSPRPSWQSLIGVLLGFVGIIILIGPWEFSNNKQPVDLLGVGALMFASLSWAIGSLYARDAKLPPSPLLATSLEMIAGGIGLLLLGTLTGEWSRVDLGAIELHSFLGLGYLIVFGSLIGFAAYTWLLRVAPTPLVATYAYVNPLVAIFLGNLLAQEPLTLRVLFSASIIIGSVALITFLRSKPRSSLLKASPVLSSGDD